MNRTEKSIKLNDYKVCTKQQQKNMIDWKIIKLKSKIPQFCGQWYDYIFYCKIQFVRKKAVYYLLGVHSPANEVIVIIESDKLKMIHDFFIHFNRKKSSNSLIQIIMIHRQQLAMFRTSVFLTSFKKKKNDLVLLLLFCYFCTCSFYQMFLLNSQPLLNWS